MTNRTDEVDLYYVSLAAEKVNESLVAVTSAQLFLRDAGLGNQALVLQQAVELSREVLDVLTKVEVNKKPQAVRS